MWSDASDTEEFSSSTSTRQSGKQSHSRSRSAAQVKGLFSVKPGRTSTSRMTTTMESSGAMDADADADAVAAAEALWEATDEENAESGVYLEVLQDLEQVMEAPTINKISQFFFCQRSLSSTYVAGLTSASFVVIAILTRWRPKRADP